VAWTELGRYVLGKTTEIGQYVHGAETENGLYVAGVALQYMRPVSDYSTGTWVAEIVTVPPDLYQHIDESVVDDADFIVSSPGPANDEVILKLSSVPTPSAGTRTLRIRFDKEPDGAGQQDLMVKLLQGPGPSFTTVQTWTQTDVGDTLTTAELDVTGTVTNYAELFISLTANQP
jgi:hypothetical protein